MRLPPLTILLSTHVAFAIPHFHKANNLYLNKTLQCVEPGIDKTCPNLCVRLEDRDELCPTNCKPDEVLCNDGKCYKNKSFCDLPTVVNPCNCGGKADSGFVPCKTPTVYAPAYLPAAKLADRCIAEIKAKIPEHAISIFECGRANADVAIGWVRDPTELAQKEFSGLEPFYIVFYAFTGFEAVLLAAWFFYKRFLQRSVCVSEPFLLNEKSRFTDSGSYVAEVTTKTKKLDVNIPTTKSEKLDEIIPNSAKGKADDIEIQGYSSSLFGTFALGSVILFSIFLQLSLLLIVLDFYGKLSGVPMAVFGLKLVIPHETNFVIVWHVTTFWLLTLQVSGKRLRNNFRIKCPQNVCDFVQVAKERDEIMVVRDNGRLLRWMRKLENVGKNVTGGDVTIATVPIQKTSAGLKFFEFQCTRFVYDASIDRFDPFEFNMMGSTQEDVLAFRSGLTTSESSRRRQLIGPNFISVFVPSFLLAMQQEFTGIFYLYQFMCLWVWYYFAYYMIGLVQTTVILISAVIRVVVRLRSELRIKKMAEFEREVRILRDGKWVKYSSADLVPGDVFEIRENENVPCDAAIISGNIVVDESSVTGEPLPVRKFPIRNDTIIYNKHSGKMNTLFDGTKVLQSNPPVRSLDPSSRFPGNGDGKATAVVVSTGTATDKGQLIHNILYPQSVSFMFNEHMKIIILILLLWGLVVFGICIWVVGATDITAWFYGLFKFAQILSPLIPATLVVGQSVAANRLRLKKIFCIDLTRVVIAGKVRIFCFDKTGTLTRDGLEWEGFQSISAGKNPIFENAEARSTALSEIVRMGISTCHAVADVNGQLVGNPVDIEQFRAAKATICGEIENVLDVIKPTNCPDASRYHVIKRFEFIHARMSMAVIVHNTDTNHVHVFVKGSFEKVKDVALPHSIPANYDDVASGHARKGCYTLALAHRDLGEIDPATVRTWTREQCEQDLRMAGLLMFKNKLKDDTKEAIMELKEGGCRPVMITGDNVLTGICIGRMCGMIARTTRIIVADIDTMEGSSSKKLAWRDYDTNEKINDIQPLLSDAKFNPVELAVTGRAFNRLVKSKMIDALLLDIRVYARMTPADKVDCVKLHMERGITAMCGDGGNDCGALRAAHVGVALSEAEASIVSPFSSSTSSIQSCVELLRQGRAALATSFAAYKFLILYGETMASMSLLQYYFGVISSQAMWMLFDGFVTVGLAGAITLGKPAARLSSKRPTARLIGPETLASSLGHIFINFSFLIGAIVLLFQQEFFVCNEFNAESVEKEKWWLLGDNYEASVIGLVALVQFINGALPFSYGYKFRAAWYKNYILVVMYIAMMAVASFLFLAPPNPFSCIFRTNCGSVDYMAKNGVSWAGAWATDPIFDIPVYNAPLQHNIFPSYFRWTLWFYCIANCLASNLYERFVILGPVRKYFMRTRPQDRLNLKL